MSDVSEKRTLPTGMYVCPDCGNTVRVYVRLTAAPECNRHSGGSKKMEVK